MNNLNQPLNNQQLYPSLGAPPGYNNYQQSPNQPQPQYGQQHIPQYGQQHHLPQHGQHNMFRNDIGTKMALKAEKLIQKQTLEGSLLKGRFLIYIIYLIIQSVFVLIQDINLGKAHVDIGLKGSICSVLSLIVLQGIIMIIGILRKSKTTVGCALAVMYIVAILILATLIFFAISYATYVKPPDEDSNLAAAALLICCFICVFALVVQLIANICVGKAVKNHIEKIDDLADEIHQLEFQV